MDRLSALRDRIRIRPGADRLPEGLNRKLMHIKTRGAFNHVAEQFLQDCQDGVAVALDIEMEHRYAKMKVPRDPRKFAVFLIGNVAGDVLALDIQSMREEKERREGEVASNLHGVIPSAVVKLLTSPQIVAVGSGIEEDFGTEFGAVFGWTPTSRRACTQDLLRRFSLRIFDTPIHPGSPVGLGFISHLLVGYDYKCKSQHTFQTRYEVYRKSSFLFLSFKHSFQYTSRFILFTRLNRS